MRSCVYVHKTQLQATDVCWYAGVCCAEAVRYAPEVLSATLPSYASFNLFALDYWTHSSVIKRVHFRPSSPTLSISIS